MKYRLSKWWFLIVLAVPFILMFCLHIGIALGNYFGININVPNVDASTWFIFCGSYLGGTMTHIAICGRNVTKRAWIMNCQEKNQQLLSCGQPPKYGKTELKRYESEIFNVEPQQNDIIAALTEVSKYSQAEIPQLNALAREYIATKQQNAYKNCFPAKEG